MGLVRSPNVKKDVLLQKNVWLDYIISEANYAQLSSQGRLITNFYSEILGAAKLLTVAVRMVRASHLALRLLNTTAIKSTG